MPKGIYIRTKNMKTGKYIRTPDMQSGKSNLGLKRSEETKTKISIALSSEKSPFWKGEKVGGAALHIWVKKHYEWEDYCQLCGSNKNLQLASKNYKYTRAKEDWWILCVSCNHSYDRGSGNWGTARKIFKERGLKFQ